jgi:hypothetical protein
MSATDEENRFINWLDLRLKVLAPSGGIETVSLDQIAPGKYSGHFLAGELGEYYLTLFGEDREASSLEPRTYGYAIPYAAEYEDQEPNLAFLEKLALISKGRVLSLEDTPQKLFESDAKTKAYGENLWPYLVLVSLALLIADVGARKLLVLRSGP